MKRAALVVVALLVLLAGCAAPFTDGTSQPDDGEPNGGEPDGGPSTDAGTDGPGSTPAGPGDGSATVDGPGTALESPGPAPADDGERGPPADPQPDPDEDVLGWEDGYWYNDPVPAAAGTELNDTAVEAVVARAMARVEYVRGLEFEETVNVSVVTRGEFNAGELGEEPSDALRTFDNAKFQALFLVGEREDSIETQDEALNTSVAGYYDGQQEAIVLVTEGDRPVLDSERTLAHELVHALQDQHFADVEDPPRLRDAYNGRNGLFEGDANVVQRTYMARCEDDRWRCLAAGGDGGPADQAADIHMGVYLLDFFPYADGPSLVTQVAGDGGWAAVNEAYERVPSTARVVIYPGEYGAFEHREVSLSDDVTGGWDRVRPPERPDYARLGQSALGAMFAYTIYNDYDPGSVVDSRDFLNTGAGGLDEADPLNYDLAPTRGWAGDRLHAYERDGEVAYVWRLAWESPAAAERFAGTYRDLLTYWGGERAQAGTWRLPEESPFTGAVAVDVDRDTVTVTGAPAVADLGEVSPGTR